MSTIIHQHPASIKNSHNNIFTNDPHPASITPIKYSDFQNKYLKYKNKYLQLKKNSYIRILF